MNFRTELNINESLHKIKHEQKLMSFGSCFANEIGERLKQLKFDILVNPFGILFHPLAIEKAIKRIIYKELYKEEEINQNGEIFFSWDHHSRFNSLSKKKILQNINNSLIESNNHLAQTEFLLITLGTSWVYHHKALNFIVANCHKAPSKVFEKRILNTAEIRTSLENTFNSLLKFNPKIKIITTISPVRHIKDGIIENNLSKSKLITSLHEVIKKYDHINYFPAYEFLMDDLRDYRFYKEDLIHPNHQAVEYIWNKFSNCYFNNETKILNDKIKRLITSINHHTFNEESSLNQFFLKKLVKQIEEINEKNPKLMFIEELTDLKKRLK